MVCAGNLWMMLSPTPNQNSEDTSKRSCFGDFFVLHLLLLVSLSNRYDRMRCSLLAMETKSNTITQSEKAELMWFFIFRKMVLIGFRFSFDLVGKKLILNIFNNFFVTKFLLDFDFSVDVVGRKLILILWVGRIIT